MRIVIIGSGFAGLNAAVKLSKKLKHASPEIIVISDTDQFVFRPSLIWLPFHDHSTDKFTFSLRPTYEKIGVLFVEDRVKLLNPKYNYVLCKDNKKIEYDYLIIASGASPDWKEIKGLEGNSASVYDIPSALETKKKLQEIQAGEAIVVGVSQQNPNTSIAYEFLFELTAFLNEREIHCPITFFTYEQNLYDGIGEEPAGKLDELMKKNDISYYCNVAIKEVDDETIYLTNEEQLPYSFSLILPPYKGMDYIFSSKNVKHKNGIVPVQKTLQSKQWENLYVVGDANDTDGAKTGRAAEMQGKLAAENIIKQMQGEPLDTFQHDTLHLMELGEEGSMFIVDKPLGIGTLKWTMSGTMPHLMKRAYEKYYLFKFS